MKQLFSRFYANPSIVWNDSQYFAANTVNKVIKNWFPNHFYKMIWENHTLEKLLEISGKTGNIFFWIKDHIKVALNGKSFMQKDDEEWILVTFKFYPFFSKIFFSDKVFLFITVSCWNKLWHFISQINF